MSDLWDRLRLRVVPALLTAFGVMLMTAGLLSYADPTTAGPVPSETPVVETLPPDATDVRSPAPTPSASPSVDRAPRRARHPAPRRAAPRPRAPRPAHPRPDAQARDARLATRVVVPGLDIDLPVIKGPPGTRRAGSRCTSRSSSSPARRARPTCTPMPGPGCSCRSSTRPRSTTAGGCWACSCRSTRATTSSTCTRSTRSGATSDRSTRRSTRAPTSSGCRPPRAPTAAPGS